MNSAGIAKAWHVRPELGMACLGLLSGVASAMWGMGRLSLDPLQPLATAFGLAPDLLPIGFFFGAALALGVWTYTGRLLAIPVLLVTTMYAWSAAVQVAIRLQRNAGDDAHLVAASLGAGAVGAGLTHIGCALVAPALRRPLRVGATCIVGAVAGMLFYLGQRQMIDERLLYVVWQSAVAFCIGLWLKRDEPVAQHV